MLLNFGCKAFNWPEEETAGTAGKSANQPVFAVSGINPADGTISVSATTSLTITFALAANTGTLSYNVSTAACATNSFQLSADNFVTCIGMAAPVWNGSQDVLTMTPLAALALNTQYKVRLTTALTGANGQALSSVYTSAGFTTVGAATLNITATNPSDAATNIGLNPAIIVTFNAQMNTGTITTNASYGPCTGTVQLSPDNFVNCVGLTAPSWSGPFSQVSFTLAAALNPGAFYKYKITTGVAGTGGEILSSAVTTPTGFATTINAPLSVQSFSGNAQNIIFWQAVSGATGYNIYFSTTPGVTVGGGTLVGSVTSPFTHTGRTNGQPYYYIVTGVNGAIIGQPSVEVSATPTPFKTIFVTSTSYSGNLGGLTGADANCATRAAAGSLPGVYKAYMSDSVNDAACRVLGLSGKLVANCGLPYSLDLTGRGPYQNRNAQLVNVNLDSLVYGKAPTTTTCAGGGPSLVNAVGYDELAAGVGAVAVLTGTQCGADDGNNCSDWTDGVLGNGRSGVANSNTSTWSTNPSLLGCLTGGRIYCVEK